MDRKLGTSRRNLLRMCSAGLWAAPAPKSKVVIARDPMLRNSAGNLLKLLDRAVQSFFDRNSPVEAWRRLVRPGEVVGLKVNCLAGKGASTSVPLVEAICERLQQAGIPAKNIVIWDRLNADLDSAGFRLASAPQRIRSMGNDELGYEDDLETFGSAASLLSRTLDRKSVV